MGNKYQGHTLLSVLAHPDDESFGMGGTLAYYAEHGADVYLICATRGEVGEVDPVYMDQYDSIAELREAELRCAAEQLGIREVHLLDYRDSGMPGSADNDHPRALVSQPQEKVVQEITELIRTLQPDVVLTFDPIGGYRHPDHIYVHEVTVEAFERSGDGEYHTASPPFQPQKLYYHTISKRYLRIVVRVLRFLGQDPTQWGKNNDIDLTQLAREEFPIHARIDYRSVADRKKAASACHASQNSAGWLRKLLNWVLKILGLRGKDLYMRAYPEPGDKLEKDLLAGI